MTSYASSIDVASAFAGGVQPTAQGRTSRRANPAIQARYDAAQPAGMNTQHWFAADALDVNAAHSKAVRTILTKRSRYELGNNGHGAGIVRTHSGYVVGRGPKLRMQTGSPDFNKMVETAWRLWARRVCLARKLRTACKAKVRDGEGWLVAKENPNLNDRVKLDLVGIETEQCTTPYVAWREKGKVDGIEFDEFGTPIFYEILPYHPGSEWSALNQKPDRIPAKFVFHWFCEDRAGQQRAVPELTSTLNLFAVGRRFREATVVAAENIANLSVLLKTQSAPSEGPDEARPFSTMPFEKGMLTALPAGWDGYQPKPEQPSAEYDSFVRSQICEEARPLAMPYNIAAADSSGYSFSGGKLDHLTYFNAGIDIEQDDCETCILDPLFELWFYEACLEYGWAADPSPAPPHTWDWPGKPKIDDLKTAAARQIDLATGAKSLRRIYAEDGYDFEDELADMAADYGVAPDEMRRILLVVNLLSKAGQFAQLPNDEPEPEPSPSPRTRSAARTGRNGRSRAFAER